MDLSRLTRVTATATLALTFAACGEQKDSYDVSKMDLNPALATVSTERHTGPFASRSSRSIRHPLKPSSSTPLTRLLKSRLALSTAHGHSAIRYPGLLFARGSAIRSGSQ